MRFLKNHMIKKLGQAPNSSATIDIPTISAVAGVSLIADTNNEMR